MYIQWANVFFSFMKVSISLRYTTKYAILYMSPLAKVIRCYCYSGASIRIPSGTVSQRRRIPRTIHLSGIHRLRYGKKGSAIRKVVKKEKAGVHVENKKARSLGK